MIAVGCYYEWPNGKVVYVYGAGGEQLRWYNSQEHGTSRLCETRQWIKRTDLLLLPDTDDRLLPYHFDLMWDIKTLNRLKKELRGHDDEDEIRAAMATFGFGLDEKPSAYRRAGDNGPVASNGATGS